MKKMEWRKTGPNSWEAKTFRFTIEVTDIEYSVGFDGDLIWEGNHLEDAEAFADKYLYGVILPEYW